MRTLATVSSAEGTLAILVEPTKMTVLSVWLMEILWHHRNSAQLCKVGGNNPLYAVKYFKSHRWFLYYMIFHTLIWSLEINSPAARTVFQELEFARWEELCRSEQSWAAVAEQTDFSSTVQDWKAGGEKQVSLFLHLLSHEVYSFEPI